MSNKKPLTTQDVATLEWWTTREVANRLNVSTSFLSDILTEENPPPAGMLLGLRVGARNPEAKKDGRRWRVHRDVLAEYERAGIPKPRQESAKFRTAPDFLGRRKVKA